MPQSFEYSEHPEEVLAKWLDWRTAERVALAMVAATEGGGVRAEGALMAVSASGRAAGYVSGGCIDADVVLHAVSAMETGRAKRLRYGAGSPFKDLPLPCGGAIEIVVDPDPSQIAIDDCHAALSARRRASLSLTGADGVVSADYRPQLRLRIAGRGADAIALARLGRASGLAVELWLRDDADLALARGAGVADLVALQTPSALPDADDDAWTAFVLTFHDPDWDVPLLRQAVSGPAFYIGAVGSRRAQSQRRAALASGGTSSAHIDRIRGPIGLVPSMRDASMLAASTLAEIVSAYHASAEAPFATTALALLAAGRSSRFEDGDKLLADLNGRRVIDHSAGALVGDVAAKRIAVVGPEHGDRRRRLERAGWRTVENPRPEHGQGASLAVAMSDLQDAPGVEAVLVLLADMPNVPDRHLHALRSAMTPGVQAVMSRTNGVLGPPALFSRDAFASLQSLTGDRGARKVFDALADTAVVDLAPEHARDVDRRADLATLEAPPYG